MKQLDFIVTHQIEPWGLPGFGHGGQSLLQASLHLRQGEDLQQLSQLQHAGHFRFAKG